MSSKDPPPAPPPPAATHPLLASLLHDGTRLLAYFSGLFLLCLAAFFLLDASDPRRHTCAYSLPRLQYRLVPLYLPYARLIFPPAFLLLYGLAQLAPHSRALRARARHIRSLALLTLAFYLAVYAAIRCGTPTVYPQCQALTTTALRAAQPLLPISLLQIPGNARYAGLPLAAPYRLDVMVAAVKPTCVNQLAMASLVEHFGPRRIFVVTPSRHCARFHAYESEWLAAGLLSSNRSSRLIHCLPEEELLPSLTVKTLLSYLRKRQAPEDRAGWYFQQFAKLLFWLRIPDITPHFLVWDSDMIMTPAFRLFNMQGQLRQHIGGTYIEKYALPYYALVHEPMFFGPYWCSFVVHQAGVYLPFLKELLAVQGLDVDTAQQLIFHPETMPSDASYIADFVFKVLDTILDGNIDMGFTEYGSYVSWVLAHHRATMEVQTEQRWTRNNLKWVVASERICCPDPAVVAAFRDQHPEYEYFGYELGHGPDCHFSDPKYADGYFPGVPVKRETEEAERGRRGRK